MTDTDLATLFEQIASVENRYNTTTRNIPEDNLVVVMLNAAPMEYQLVLMAEQRAQGDKLILDHLEMVRNESALAGGRFTSQLTQQAVETEILLITFCRICFTCGEKGHKVTTCPKKGSNNKNNGGKQSGGRKDTRAKAVFHMQQVGYLLSNCWEKEENASKRPATWKPADTNGQEIGATTVRGNKVKFLLCGMTFPYDAKILEDLNVWIADMAVTVHSTPSAFGFENQQSTLDGCHHNGKWRNETTKMLAELPGMIYDKEGHELHEATLSEVTHLPCGKFNLSSLFHMVRMGGWKLGGNKEAIWIKKDRKEI